MIRTIVSLLEKDKKWVEAEGRRRGVSGSAVIRLGIRDLRRKVEGEGRGAGSTRVAEKRAEYGQDALVSIIDPKELRRRSAAAAGRFSSGVPDLSIEHDRYAWGESGDAEDVGNEADEEGRPKSGSGTGRGTRSGRREWRTSKESAR
jgi:hypothetical protein